MTTPAINRDSNLVAATSTTYYNYGTAYGPYPGPNKEWKRVTVVKPESVSTPVPGRGLPRITTPWYRERRSYSTGLLNCEVHYAGFPSAVYQFQTNGLAYNAQLQSLNPWRWDLRGRAINGALANLKDQKIDLSVAFAERLQTASLFDKNIRRVAELYGDLKRGKRGVWDYMKNFRVDPTDSRIRQVPKAWLETQYAVRPLVQDVFGATEKLNQLERSPNAYFFITKKSYEENDTRLRSDTGFCYAFGHSDKPLVVDYECEERAHTSLVYRLKNPLTRELANLGITNPLSTAYELVTFSFVLDWALPVGDYLNLLDADYGWEFLTGSSMLSQRVTGKGTHFIVNDGSSILPDGDLSLIQYNNFAMFREVHTSSPWPVYPTFKNPLSSVTRTSSAIALLFSVFAD